MDTDEILDNVRYSEEEDFLLDILERFNPKNIHAALREYFEEERTLFDILERFDDHHVNSALREYFGLQPRNKLPDFVDAEKL